MGMSVQPSMTSISLTDDYGVAVAQGGFIIRTEDGGENWKLTENQTKNDLMGVHFATSKEAWAVGWNGTLLHSNRWRGDMGYEKWHDSR